MAVNFGSARIDEKGNATGGVAGNQSGRELLIEPYYAHPLGWKCYRAKDPKVADALSKAMIEACTNSHIGYDQNQRLGVITQLEKYGRLGKIAVNTECDCSSLVRACCIQVGINVPNFTTYNEGKALEATGKFEPAFTVTSESQLYNGDILVTLKKGHTGIICSGRARKVEPSESNKQDSQTDGKLSRTPKWVGQVTAHLLNVRTWAGTEFPRITKWTGGQLAKGNKVDVCDTVNDSNGKPWYYIRIAGSIYGFVDARYIKKVS